FSLLRVSLSMFIACIPCLFLWVPVPFASVLGVFLVVLQCASFDYLSTCVSAVSSDEICRQLAGLPSRRLRRSGQPLHLPCRQLLEQQRRRPDAL
uniref:Uncharacterized protein n=1 Tax=Melopsittacus undulatus TaxID=13146 RepID=A0A8C6JWJ1_MELUD